MIIDADWKEIVSFTYHFTRRDNFPINSQVLLKGTCKWRKFYNILTMPCRIIIINPLQNDQRHVHHITIKYSLINVFVLLFICSIIKNHYNSVIATTNNLRVFAILYYTISRLINFFFDLWIPGKRKYCCEILETIYGIILIVTMKLPNFGSDWWW